MNKKWKNILLAVTSALLLGCMILVMVDSMKKEIVIEEPNTPLSATKTVTASYVDSHVIPDKYNTGCLLGEMTPVKLPGTVNGIQYTEYGTAGNGWLRLEFLKTNKSLGNDIVIKNCDFSGNSLIITFTEKLSSTKTVHFINCKFDSFKTSSNENLVLDFQNCEMMHFTASNATCDRCFFGNGSLGDAVNPGNNCRFTNCFIADILKKGDVQETNHIDGVQFFAGNSNVSFENCRFEIPAVPYSVSAGLLNCPITFTLRSGNASDISFSNCYVNGGLHYGIQLVSSKGYTFNNISFNNVSVGQSSRHLIDDESGLGLASTIKTTDKLYIGSVWKNSGKIHLSVTNDTNDVRTLLIKTNKEEKEVTIPACPKATDIPKDSMNYSDFPFDIDTTVGDADWVVCYDITNGVNTQIRFENWSGKEISVEEMAPPQKEAAVAPPATKQLPGTPSSSKDLVKESSPLPDTPSTSTLSGDVVVKESGDSTKEVEKPVLSGKCGNSVSYELIGNTLFLSGTGKTYNYNSANTAPWYSQKSQIKAVNIAEGITTVGSAMFLNCDQLTDVYIPDGVTVIDINAFNKCKKLTTISIPDSVTAINKYAFSSCALKTVYFRGTEEQWNAITFGANCCIDSTNIAKEFVAKEVASQAMYSGTCGSKVNWTIYDNGKLVISGSGDTYNYHSANPVPWDAYKKFVTDVVVEEGVTGIGNYLFSSHTSLVSVVLADSVTRIGNNAFSKDKELISVSFGNGVKSIDKYAFNSDNKLTDVSYSGTESQWSDISFGAYNGVQNKEIKFQ